MLPMVTPHSFFGRNAKVRLNGSCSLVHPFSGSVMAGWESCRHSARHRLGLHLAKPGQVKRLEIDTYMHCLNPFRFIAVLALNGASPTAFCAAKFATDRQQ